MRRLFSPSLTLALAVVAVVAAVAAPACDDRSSRVDEAQARAEPHIDTESVVGRLPAQVIEMPAATIAVSPPQPWPATMAMPSLLKSEALRSDGVDVGAMGEELLRAGRPMEAVVAFRKALVRDASADVWAGLGDAYLRVGEVGSGLACLQEAVAVDVDHVSARRLLARHHLAQRDGELARQHAEEWVRLEPASPSARQALGRAYCQLGMWREAIAEFTLVVAEQPDNAYAYNNLGYAALQIGDAALAVSHLEKILTMRPQEGFMLNNLGVAYERAGRHAFAHAAFARAAELSPRYAQAALNRDRLQRGLLPEERVVSAETLAKLRSSDVEVERNRSAPSGTDPDPPTMPSLDAPTPR